MRLYGPGVCVEDPWCSDFEVTEREESDGSGDSELSWKVSISTDVGVKTSEVFEQNMYS